MTQPLVILLQEQTAQLLGTLQEQMTQHRLTLQEQSTHQLVTLQKQQMRPQRATLQEQLIQQLGMLQERMIEQRTALQEQTGQQLATLDKLMTLQLAILDNLKKMQSHEIALDQGQCSLRLPDQAKSSKTAKKPREENLFFPEEVIEKILSRMPLPSLLKIRLLSKPWLAKLPSHGMKSSLTTLQKEVISVSSTWSTYSPVFLTNTGLRGFDRVSSQWKSIFTISHLSFKSWSSNFISSLGPLVLVISYNSDGEDDEDLEDDEPGKLIVTNLLTRSWKELIIPSTVDTNFGNGHEPDFVRLLPGDLDTYRVIIVYHLYEVNPPWTVKTILYDSRVSDWSVTYTVDLENIRRFYFSSVYLHGKLYCICDGNESDDPWTFCIHHVDSDKTWMAIPLDLGLTSWGIVAGGVLLCGKKIMVVIWRDRKLRVNQMVPRIQIYHFDIDSLQLVNESDGPPRIMMGVVDSIGDSRDETRFASDEHFIYFGKVQRGIPMLTYNVQCGEWGSLPPAYYPFCSMEQEGKSDLLLESAFVPGMNPFANV